MVLRSEFLAVKDFIAFTSSGVHEKKMKIMFDSVPLILEWLYRWSNDRIEVNSSSNTCWKLCMTVLAYWHNMFQERDMYVVRLGNRTDQLNTR